MRNFKVENNIFYIQCPICLKYLSIDKFHKHPNGAFGIYNICKKCQHEKIRLRLINNSKHNKYKQKMRKQYEEKYRFNRGYFHKKTHRFIKKYNLLPKRCDLCGKYDKIQTHHPWYRSKEDWKYVCFVCPQCHYAIHHGLIQEPDPCDLEILKNFTS